MKDIDRVRLFKAQVLELVELLTEQRYHTEIQRGHAVRALEMHDEARRAQFELLSERDELLRENAQLAKNVATMQECHDIECEENQRLRTELAERIPSVFNSATHAVLGDEP